MRAFSTRFPVATSASLLIAAAEWYRANGSRIKGPIVMAAFGAGLNWGALLADPC